MEKAESAGNKSTKISKDFHDMLLLSYHIMISHEEVESYEIRYKTPFSVISFSNTLYNYVTRSKNVALNDIIALAESYYHISYSYTYHEHSDRVHIEKLFIADYYLMRCMKLLTGIELDCKVIWLAVRALNDLSRVWQRLKNLDKSSTLINKSLELYLTYTGESNNYSTPINILSFIDKNYNEDYKKVLDKLHLETLNLMITHAEHPTETSTTNYEPMIDEKIIVYTHKLLKKQLNWGLTGVILVEWALESAKLSRCFRLSGRFIEAKNHLDAAYIMLEEFYKDSVAKDKENSTKSETLASERRRDALACLNVAEARFGIALLQASLKQLQQNIIENEPSQPNRLKLSFKISNKEQPKELLLFTNLKEKKKQACAKIKDNYISNYNEAKEVFIQILKYLNVANQYNNKIDNNDKIYAEITRDISKAYKCLAAFDQDRENQIKLHKRRIDLLKDVSKMTKNVEIVKQIFLDQAIIYSTLLEMNTDWTSIVKENLQLTSVPNISKDIIELIKQNLNYLSLSMSEYYNK